MVEEGSKVRNPIALSVMFSKSHVILGLKVATIAGTILAIFHQDLAIVLNDAIRSESMTYILAIPFLFAFMTYRKRKMLRAVIPTEGTDNTKLMKYLPTISGITISSTAVLLYWYGSYTFTPLEYHTLALPILVAGLTLVLFNLRTLRQLAFPVAFLTFLTPPPLETVYAFGSTLSMLSSEVSCAIVSFLGIPSSLAIEYGNPIIQITRANGATIAFAVDIACSGIYSLIGFLVFAVFVAYIVRGKSWKKLILFLIGLVVVYALNITRITTIVLIGYQFGEEIALQLFHLLGGWILIFIGTLLLLVFSEKILHLQIFVQSTQKCTGCNPKLEDNRNFCLNCGRILKSEPGRFRKVDIAKIASIVVCTILLISIQTPVFSLTEGPAQIMIQTPTGEQGNTQLLPQIQGYALEYVYRDRDFEEVSGQDASLVYAYFPIDEGKESVWVTVEIGSGKVMLHNWEVCLISWQIYLGAHVFVTQLDLKDVQISENPPTVARYFAFQWIKTNQTQVVLYWFGDSIFRTNNTSQQKRVKISLITYPENAQNITRIEGLAPFAAAIVNYWEPIKTWSQIALLLSQQSIYLVAVTATMLPIFAILYTLEIRKQRKTNAQAYQKLSVLNRQIINAVAETERTTTPTLQAIADTYKKKERIEFVDKKELLQRLSQAEKTGIILSDIANVRDEPTQIWKTRMK
jgi:exosortase